MGALMLCCCKGESVCEREVDLNFMIASGRWCIYRQPTAVVKLRVEKGATNASHQNILFQSSLNTSQQELCEAFKISRQGTNQIRLLHIPTS